LLLPALMRARRRCPPSARTTCASKA
jgi:hypothetical protein